MSAPYQRGYLVLGEDVAGLHETPEGGWILGRYKQEIDLSLLQEGAPQTFLNSAPIFPVNATAMKLLKLSDGSRTGEQILGELASEYKVTVEEVEEAVLPFVRRSMQLSHLVPQLKPSSQTVALTGSDSYYMPAHASVELTSRCNFRCAYCYRSAEYAEGDTLLEPEMSREDVFHVLDQLREAGVSVVELTGGEVLMHPDIEDIIAYCGENFRLCALLTNGSLIDEKVAKALRSAGNFFVSVSLDGPNAEIVDRMAGRRNVFDRICKGVLLLKEHGVHARLAMTITEDNIAVMEETLLLAVELQGMGFSAAPIMNQGRARDAKNDKTLTCRFLVKMAELCRKYPTAVVLGSQTGRKNAEEKGNCGMGWRSVTVAPDGSVRACLANLQTWSKLGNLREQSLRELCQSDRMKFFRETRWPRAETCGSCEYLWYCGNCTIRGIDTALRYNSNCQWAKDENIWDWIFPDADEEEVAPVCKRAASKK